LTKNKIANFKNRNILKEKNIFTLKYHFRPFLTVCCLITSVTCIWIDWILISARSVVGFLSIIFTVFMIYATITQFILVKKRYHFLVDQDALMINPAKKILLSDIKGIALDWNTIKGNTIYLLQLAVLPEVWCSFYKKEARLKQYRRDYEELYIVIPVTNQNYGEMHELVHFIEQSGVSKRTFIKPVLGKYLGKPRINELSNIENPIVLRQKRQRRISKIIKFTFILFSIIYLIMRLLNFL
jgi:hypothetical protein